MNSDERRLVRSTVAGLLAKSDALRKSPADSPPFRAIAGWIYETVKLILHHSQVLDDFERRVEGLEAAHAHQMGVIEDVHSALKEAR